jgi:hypothetical protein
LIISTTIDQTGKIVVGGSYGTNAHLTRYSSTGIRDTSFNTNGVALNNLATTAVINRVKNVGTGYLIAGVSDTDKFTTARYTAGGLADTYGTAGVVQETTVGQSAACDMLINGTSLCVVGYINTTTAAAINYNTTTGARNTTIDQDGIEEFFSFGNGKLNAISNTTSEDRFGAGTGNTIAILKLLTTVLDREGLLQDSNPPFNDMDPATIFDYLIDQDGNLVVCGSFNNSIVLIRYLPNSTRDTNFGTNGVVLFTAINPSAANALTQDTDGNYYIAANSQVAGQQVFTFGKFDNDGAFQYMVQETGTGAGKATSIGVNANGTTVTVTGQTTGNGVLVPTVVTYTLDGQKVLAFGTNGIKTYTSMGSGVFNDMETSTAESMKFAGQTQNKATITSVSTIEGNAGLLDNILTGF